MIGSGKGSRPGQLNCPCGVAVNDEHVFVCDRRNKRVQIFRKSDAVFVRELRQAASDGLEATKPFFISIEDDQLFVTDLANQRVVVFQG